LVFEVHPLTGHSPTGITLLQIGSRLLFSGDALGTQGPDAGLILREPLAAFSTALTDWRATTNGRYDVVYTARNYQWFTGAAYLDQLQEAVAKGLTGGDSAWIDSAQRPGTQIVRSSGAADVVAVAVELGVGAHAFDGRDDLAWPQQQNLGQRADIAGQHADRGVALARQDGEVDFTAEQPGPIGRGGIALTLVLLDPFVDALEAGVDLAVHGQGDAEHHFGAGFEHRPAIAFAAVEVALHHMNTHPPALPEHLERFQAMMDKLLEKDRDARFRNADEVIGFLSRRYFQGTGAFGAEKTQKLN
jgi:hypothetical protein